ncbi:CRM-domain containing factor CFM3, chloroplastic/mitochondrial [Silene latifolia]|uniref:CRM-domain containing factor CFM3, chloroplastic/mitochondrial n=1 Tax=Silene latifolia TaxID=37657 RepID=UPI003D76F484
MQIHKKMVFTTTKLSELSIYNTLHFTPSSTSCSSTPCFLKSHKNSISLFKTFSSLKTTQTNKNPLPKTSSSAPWLKKWPSMDPPPPPTIATNSVSDSVVSSRNIVESRGSSSAIDRIVGKLRNLGLEDDDEDDDDDDDEEKPEKLGDLLRRDWIRDDAMLIEEKKSDFGLLPWEKDELEEEEEEFGKVNEVRESVKKTKRVVKPPTLAEKTIEEAELKRLRGQGMVLKDKVNVAKAGITQSVLEKIHAKWRKSELVRLKFHEDLAHDMKTAHILVERRTGGLVLWRSGSVMVVYRGTNYKGPQLDSAGQIVVNTTAETIAAEMPHKHRHNPTAEEREYNDLLDGLGPRFGDWWGTGLLPIDADLLPQTVPGYKPPRRLLPVGMRVGLTNAELTDLRKLAKTLPCHFALGRNRNHQGLAAAIVKLWEKSLVAKIAVKRGIQNTNNELMSEELKRLTGGTLLLRNKFFIVIYRGKDFLPTTVAAAVTERMEVTKRIEDAEEEARSATIEAATTDEQAQALAGTLAEFYEAQARWGREISPEEYKKMREEASRAKTVKVVKRIEHKLAQAQSKKLRAESLLSKIEASMVPVGPSDDQETITDEERFTFRKIGLQMKAYLPVGVRGIFDGVIENMHLHWKHRELVKLISKQKNLGFVEETARLLEYESGGILVAIERVPKGYALIYYRGKNYQRPISLRPRNLLTKAKALKRAIAMQRHEALSEHITELEKNIDEMRKEMGSSETSKDENVMKADGEFRPMSEYQSEDEDSEDEDDYDDGEIYDSDDDDDDDDDDGGVSNVEDNHDRSIKFENW